MHAAVASSIAVASGRVSYVLELTGPCLSVDTACSASLVALHIAETAVFTGECHSACVCGENQIDKIVDAAFHAAGMLSALGRCHTFDR